MLASAIVAGFPR